jgi:hypothetical protein
MKRFVVILLLVTSFHCRKAENKAYNNSLIEGNWELRKSEGGIAGTILYPSGNGVILRFDERFHYSMVRNSAVYEMGTYLVSRTTTPGILQLQLKNLSNSLTTTISVRLTASTLILLPASVCCDMATYTYNKI